jgi:thymidylate synthase
MISVNEAWLATIEKVITHGAHVWPRGLATLELPSYTFTANMSWPVLTVKERQLSYIFLAAEALWILSGDDTVAGIAPYNKNIARFSDDGKVFTGAYGPPIAAQFNYVVNKLLEDRQTRQAVMTTWRPNPTSSKDIPCTIAFAFSVRDELLNLHVFMRSSDIWLGLPYDAFNFSLLAAKIACYYNTTQINVFKRHNLCIKLGALFLTAASSHLYQSNLTDARACLKTKTLPTRPLPEAWVLEGRWNTIATSLIACRDRLPQHNVWQIRPTKEVTS